MKHVLLVGNPNCGKTTVFNALTGENQRVGNWPGVTVEKKTGAFLIDKQPIEITDLPGIYSLTITEDASSQDEKISAKALVNLSYDTIINVIDACHLERHLYLTTQLLELNKPIIIALNMSDIARQQGITIDVNKLSEAFGCQVVTLEAHKKIGIHALQLAIANPAVYHVRPILTLPATVQAQLDAFTHPQVNTEQFYYYANRLLEGDDVLLANYTPFDTAADYDIILADARYKTIHQYIPSIQKKRSDASEHITAKIDKIVLHRFLALPIFLAIMYLMFLFAINIGGAFQDFFDITTNAIFVQGSAYVLHQLHTPDWLIALLANGVGVGINTVLTFIPVIAAMYFFLALLEASGYMARAAFVVDKLMRLLGLPGKSFVPMIVGFGCNVPAIMAARTLDSEQDRLLTVMMSPFMSCSARLAIYAVFVSAFFPTGGQNIVFSLYMIGIIIAILTGLLLRKTALKGDISPLIIELPAYHRPKIARLLKETNFRLRYFVRRAGRIIIPVCIILGGLNALTIDGGVSHSDASSQSVLSLIGQWLTYFFSPMGLTADNWPATVGLLTGMLAKEVVIGTLNSLYAQVGHIAQGGADSLNILHSLYLALMTIPDNFSHLGQALFNPILASAPDDELSQSVYGMMVTRFDGQAGAFAYLLFILLYIPCVSTMAVIRQETTQSWMWFSVAWSLLVAYAAATIFYQVARFSIHPQQSLFWIMMMVSSIAGFIALLHLRSLSKVCKKAIHISAS